MPKEKEPTIRVVDSQNVERVGKNMPKEAVLCDLAEFFKVFGDSTRVKILWALTESEMCVCDLAALLNMTMSSISHQLRILKQARLVRFRREGKTVYYSPDDDHISSIFEKGMEHVLESYYAGSAQEE